MRLDELAAAAQDAGLGAPEAAGDAPAWARGCFRRRSITFFDGHSDETTEVYWLQTRRLTADLRLPASRPRGRAGNNDAAGGLARAAFEGGLARSTWDGAQMSWSEWTALQLHDRWPEPGLLRRVGDCLIEHAPSGAYVEDWRLQPSPDGPLLGLRLIEERDLARGEVTHRGGGLIVCGAHAAFVRGRPQPLAEAAGARLVDLVRAHAGDPAAAADLLRRAFGFEASYAARIEAGPFVVQASTDPAREGEALLDLDGFTLDPTGAVVQRTTERGRALERLFTVETAAPWVRFSPATAATPTAHAWREAEFPAAGATPPSPLPRP